MKSYSELIGMEISQVRRKLGYWWICTSCHLVTQCRIGTYSFERAAGAWIELRTENNLVVSETHNFYAEHLLKREL